MTNNATDSTRFLRFKKFLTGHPLFASVLVSALMGIGLSFLGSFFSMAQASKPLSPLEFLSLFLAAIIAGVLVGAFLPFPIILTLAELYLLFVAPKRETLHNRGRAFDLLAVTLGILYSVIYLDIIQGVLFYRDWDAVLSNAQKHTPVYTQSLPTVFAVAAVGLAGYLMVNFIPLKKMPPLVLVLGISAIYLGTLESIIWGYQVNTAGSGSFFLLLLPLNCLLITARTVVCKVLEWKKLPREMHRIQRSPFLRQCCRILEKSELWPIAAFLLMWPLLGILIGILTLFGQAPDSVIRAWTETGGWNLSRRVSPQNIYYDEHYLCTVAAGGHKSVVKPLRLGVRHGHEVIVNRQLCVANAFEQILEEKTPGFHRLVRSFYDKYGFPVARLIRSKYMADFIYFLMKPLEWVFLAALYLTDVHPENRIALQYTGKRLGELLPESKQFSDI